MRGSLLAWSIEKRLVPRSLEGRKDCLQRLHRVNGFHAITYGFSRRGVQLWEKWIDNRPDGSCCASSWTVKTIALRQGGSLTVANRVDRSNNSVNLYYVGVLQELDEKGTYQ